jgi:hypothetical protein
VLAHVQEPAEPAPEQLELADLLVDGRELGLGGPGYLGG